MVRIDETACIGCGDCVEVCPAGAIALVDGLARIEHAVCTDCGSCAVACPQGAIVMASAASPVYSVARDSLSLPPVAPSTSAIEVMSSAHRPQVEILPAELRGARFWPVLGSAVGWAARELLPAVLRAWQEMPQRAEGTLIKERGSKGASGGATGQRRNQKRYRKHGAARGR